MDVLKHEKQRFITDYGSTYKSEPHITLYLESYTTEGLPKLLEQLRGLRVEPFTISLLEPNIRRTEDHHHNLYVMDVSNKEHLVQLHEIISEIARPYRSPVLREKTGKRLENLGIFTDGLRANLNTQELSSLDNFDPHITLGEIDFDKPQADISEVRKNLKPIEGVELTISSIKVFWYGKEGDSEKAKMLEEITIPLEFLAKKP